MRHPERHSRTGSGRERGIRPARHPVPRLLAIVAWCGFAGAARAADGPAAPVAAPANAWATGGGPATAPASAGVSAAAPVGQAYAMPGTVIRGGAIPPGWQPQPIPYSGLGPDGRPVTVYVAPTYTFTFVSGPPVLAAAAPSGVNRVQAMSPPPGGFVYRTSGAPAATTYFRSPPVPYRYPDGAATLAGQPLVPPASPAAPPPMFAQSPVAPPPAVPPPALAPPPVPPTQWVSVPPATATGDGLGQALASAAPAAIAGGAAAIAAADHPPPPATIAPTPPPIETPPPAATRPEPPLTPVSAPAPPPAVPTTTHVWRVVGVHDGDTITCLDETNTQQKVRLAEIDAPELGQDYGKVARESLAELVFGKSVTVVEEGKDRYGRWIARVQVDGTDVNRRLVATGNAWHYADYSRDSALDTLQEQARLQRMGLWAQPDPVPPWEFRQNVKKAAAG